MARLYKGIEFHKSVVTSSETLSISIKSSRTSRTLFVLYKKVAHSN